MNIPHTFFRWINEREGDMRHNTGMDMTEMMSHIIFVDPNRSALDSLYAAHPPIDERIRRLREM